MQRGFQSNYQLQDKPNAKVSDSMRRFLNKLSEELFEDFSKSDWLMYFQMKFKECNGFGYHIAGKIQYSKHYAVISSLMKNYTTEDIKAMIDFLFDSSQDLQDKKRLTIYYLSGGFLTGVYLDSQLWLRGEYLNKREQWDKEKEEAKKKELQQNKRRREWTTKDEDKPQEKKVKKLPLKKKETSSESKGKSKIRF
jgi:hypothetical protein